MSTPLLFKTSASKVALGWSRSMDVDLKIDRQRVISEDRRSSSVSATHTYTLHVLLTVQNNGVGHESKDLAWSWRVHWSHHDCKLVDVQSLIFLPTRTYFNANIDYSVFYMKLEVHGQWDKMISNHRIMGVTQQQLQTKVIIPGQSFALFVHRLGLETYCKLKSRSLTGKEVKCEHGQVHKS